jgi:hypothetical protein
MVECQFSIILSETTNRKHSQYKCFKTRNIPVFEETDLDLFITDKFRKLIREMEESELKIIRWSFLAVDGLRLRINRYNPLRGSTSISLPQEINAKKACVNIQNFNKKWFIY